MIPCDPRTWKKFANAFRKLGESYPEINAVRDAETGKWTLGGGTVGQLAFTKLAAKAARRSGFGGTDEQCLQYWLNLLYGDKVHRGPR